MIGMIKNDLISYQAYSGKVNNLNLKRLHTELTNLKNEAEQDMEKIFSLEKKIDDLIDARLRNEVENNANFEILNDEKITPHFVKLMRVSKKTKKLEIIRDRDGNVFPDPESRDFYKDLFRNLQTFTKICSLGLITLHLLTTSRFRSS
jgi:hypothetical protein